MPFVANILKSGIKIVKDLMPDMQSQVTIYPWLGKDVHGDDTYGDPITLPCVVDLTNRVVYQGAQQVMVFATLDFLGDVQPNGAPGRREPIDPFDKIVLPNGSTGPIVSTPDGVMNPGTNRGFKQSVMLGAR